MSGLKLWEVLGTTCNDDDDVKLRLKFPITNWAENGQSLFTEDKCIFMVLCQRFAS